MRGRRDSLDAHSRARVAGKLPVVGLGLVALAAVACGAAGPAPRPVSDPPASSSQPPSQAESPPTQPDAVPRKITCATRVAGPVGAELSRTADGSSLSGWAHDNYDDATYAECAWAHGEVRCDASWDHAGGSASLRIQVQRGGASTGWLTLHSGQSAEMPCELTFDPT